MKILIINVFFETILLLILSFSFTYSTLYSQPNGQQSVRSSDASSTNGPLAHFITNRDQFKRNNYVPVTSWLPSFLQPNTLISSVLSMIGLFRTNQTHAQSSRINDDNHPQSHQVYDLKRRAYAARNHHAKRYSTTNWSSSSHASNPRQIIPLKKFEASLSYDAPPKTIHRSPATQKSLKDEAWAETLFGPQGVLTAIFRMIDDRQMGPEHIASKAGLPANTIPKDTQQHDLPFFLDLDFFKNAKRIDFARIFEAFLTNSQGDFGDPISELPEFLGICNRLSCGDIYKAIDQFRKSEFFTNFQTAMQLIQDPKGWEIIGDLLSNPELIAQFTSGPGGIEKLIGSVTTAVGNKPKPVNGRRPPTDIGPGDGDLGIDFSGLTGEKKPFKEKKPTAEELPEIAENIDATDYYNAVESGVDELEETSSGVETVEIAPFPSKTKIESVEVKKEKLPEISESIDEKGEVSIKVDGTDSLVIDKSGYMVNRPLSSTNPPSVWKTSRLPPYRLTSRVTAFYSTTTKPHHSSSNTTLTNTSRMPDRSRTHNTYPPYTYGTRFTRLPYTPHTYSTRSPYPYSTRSPYPYSTRSPYPYSTRSPYPYSTRSPYPYSTHSPYPYSTRSPYTYSTRPSYTYSTRPPYTYSTRPPFTLSTRSTTSAYRTLTYSSFRNSTYSRHTTLTTPRPTPRPRGHRVTMKPIATTRNFRKDSDYYAMYYDDDTNI